MEIIYIIPYFICEKQSSILFSAAVFSFSVIQLLVPGAPHMFFFGGFRRVLRHDAHQLVWHVHFLQISDLAVAERQVYGFGCAFDVMKLCSAHYRSGHFGEKPCQGNFCHGHTVFVRQLCHPVNDDGVLLCGGVVFEAGVAVFFQSLGDLARVFGQASAREL